jgi:uncharacterized phage protein (TIGR01671 family)
MTERLFRGKWIGFDEWLVGDLIQYSDTYQCIRDHRIGTYDKYPVYIESVGQFTGLTDVNNVKIFEGDIGIYNQTDGAKSKGNPIVCVGKVVYNEKTASFAVDGKDEAGRKYFDYFQIEDFEIIGNTYDNPELLEAK